MKTIFEKEIKGIISDFNNTDESLSFKVGEETVSISTEHRQDCCEHVYGDFSVTKHLKSIEGKGLQKLEIKPVEDIGFLLVLQFVYDNSEKIFVPCYNYQNGYYSSSLSLSVKIGETKTEIDISNLVEDHID